MCVAASHPVSLRHQLPPRLQAGVRLCAVPGWPVLCHWSLSPGKNLCQVQRPPALCDQVTGRAAVGLLSLRVDASTLSNPSRSSTPSLGTPVQVQGSHCPEDPAPGYAALLTVPEALCSQPLLTPPIQWRLWSCPPAAVAPSLGPVPPHPRQAAASVGGAHHVHVLSAQRPVS